MKKITKITTIILAMILGCFAFISCETDSNSQESYAYVTLRINPQIELVANNDGEVIAANAINEDGEIVLAELILSGMTIEEAAETFTNKAVELGYIDISAQDVAVHFGIESEDEEFVENTKKRVSERINKYFDNNGIYGKISQETLEEYLPKAAEWDVSVGHAKMILRILDIYPEMTDEEILELSVKERMELIRDNGKNNGVAANLNQQYKDEIEELKTKYSEMFDLREDIAALYASINEELTDEEKQLIEEEISAKEQLLKELHDTYKAEFEQKKEEFRNQSKAKREAAKAEHQLRKNQNSEKIEQHIEQFKNNVEELKERIRQWRQKNSGSKNLE